MPAFEIEHQHDYAEHRYAGQFGSKSPDFARENTLSDSAGAQHKVILQKALEYLQEDGKRVDDPNSLMQNLMDFQEQKSKKG